MKKRIRKTGEIVDVIDYLCIDICKEREDGDWVSYVDSKGTEHHCVKGLNLYWDLEDVEDELHKEIDWEEHRIIIASQAMQVFIREMTLPNEPDINMPDVVKYSVKYADAIIAELKRGGNNEQ